MNRIKITLLLLTLNSVAIFAQDLEDGLLLHYEFNGDTEDASINDFTGVPNGITYGLDRYGNPASAAYFDGIDDFIDLPYLEVLKPDLPITISFWVKFDNLSYENASVFNTSYENDVSSGVYFTTTADDSRIAVGYGDGSFGYSPSNRRTYVSNSSITADEWHNITVILISATEMKVYLDCRDMGGEYSGSCDALAYSDTPGSIGRHDRHTDDPGDYFKGALDDFRYWNRALPPTEVSMLCDEPSGVDEVVEMPKINIYPNPVDDELFIEFSGNIEPQILNFHNLDGQIVYVTTYTNHVNIAHLPSGIYILSLVHREGVINRKVVVK